MGRLERAGSPRSARVRDEGRGRGWQAPARTALGRGDRRDARRARRPRVHRRPGSRPEALRRGAPPRDEQHPPGARQRRDRAPHRRARARFARACDLPRLAGAQRRARRRPRAARPRPRRPRGPQGGAGRLLEAPCLDRRGLAPPLDRRRHRRGLVASPPGLRPPRRRPRGRSHSRRWDARGARGPGPRFRARRALAPRGRRRSAALRGARLLRSRDRTRS